MVLRLSRPLRFPVSITCPLLTARLDESHFSYLGKASAIGGESAVTPTRGHATEVASGTRTYPLGGSVSESVGHAERYDFCLSFASEQRAYVEEVARLLANVGLRVFYDAHESAHLLGVDLYAHLDEIYNRGSRYCVLFASEAYVRKMWTGHERVSAQDRALRSPSEYVLPVRFDDTEIPGLRGAIGFVDARVTSPAALAQLLVIKLGTSQQVDAVPASVVVLAADVHADLRTTLIAALSECHVSVPDELIFAHTSRAIGVIPESILSVADVTTMLTAKLERVARERPDLKLTIAVHRGAVPADQAADCVDVTEAVEAAVSAAVAEVLRGAVGAHCAVIVTQRVYDTVVRPGRGGSNPQLFNLVTTSDGTGLFVRVPGYPRLPAHEPTPKPGSSSPSGGNIGKVTYFAGPVRARRIGDTYLGNDDGGR